MTSRAFDVRQYRLLVDLLRTLGSRRELTSQFGLNAPALGVISAFALLLGGLVALIVSVEMPPARNALVLCLAATSILLIPLLVSEAADALLNPAEVAILAPRPIGDVTYLAAKITYVLRFALTLAMAINLLPALAGVRLDGAAWFYPLTHLGAAALAAAFTALATCGVFGIVFRVVPVARVRNASLWAQLVGVTLVPLAPHVMNMVEIQLDLDRPYWSALPLTWFAAIGLAGQQGGPVVDPRFAVPALVVTITLIVAGVRALTRGYMTRVTMTLRSRRPRPPRARRGRLGAPLAWLAGSVAGRGAAGFVVQMATRDWQFRREFLRAAMAPVIPLVLFAFRRGARSPFDVTDGFSTAHAIPHAAGLVLMSTCQFLAFSDHYRARWIFLTVPASGLRGLVRGSLAALWLCGAVAPALVILTFGSIAWGVVDAALFAMYGLSVASLYLGVAAWMQAGLPFTRPPNPARATSAAGVTLLFVLVAVLFAVVQAYVIFPRAAVVLACTAAFTAAAWLAARASFRVLEARVPGALRSFTDAPRRTFGSIGNDA